MASSLTTIYHYYNKFTVVVAFWFAGEAISFKNKFFGRPRCQKAFGHVLWANRRYFAISSNEVRSGQVRIRSCDVRSVRFKEWLGQFVERSNQMQALLWSHSKRLSSRLATRLTCGNCVACPVFRHRWQ